MGQIPTAVDRRLLVLEFDGKLGDVVPQAHRQLFKNHVSEDQFFTPGGNIPALIERLVDALARAPKGTNTIFIDISSMPRAWYLGIVTWFRFSTYAETHRLLFGYAGASYSADYPTRQIVELRRVMGTGGYYDASQAVTAIVSLGFDGGAALSVSERIEPDDIIAIVSESQGFEAAKLRCLKANEDFLHHADHTLYLPHLSFSEPYRAICELIAPLNDRNIVCIPLGPKTHILALALAGFMFSRATSLHVQSKYDRAFVAEPNGLFCFAELSVLFEGIDQAP